MLAQIQPLSTTANATVNTGTTSAGASSLPLVAQTSDLPPANILPQPQQIHIGTPSSPNNLSAPQLAIQSPVKIEQNVNTTITTTSLPMPRLDTITNSSFLPAVTMPALNNPTITNAKLTAPALSVHSLSTPNLSTHNLSAPNLSVANLSAPNLSAPNLSAPNLSAPNLSTPNFSVANLTTPTLASTTFVASNLVPTTSNTHSIVSQNTSQTPTLNNISPPQNSATPTIKTEVGHHQQSSSSSSQLSSSHFHQSSGSVNIKTKTSSPRRSVKIMIPSQGPPPSLMNSSLSSLNGCTHRLTSPNLFNSSSLMGTLDTHNFTGGASSLLSGPCFGSSGTLGHLSGVGGYSPASPHHSNTNANSLLGSPLSATTLAATVLIPSPTQHHHHHQQINGHQHQHQSHVNMTNTPPHHHHQHHSHQHHQGRDMQTMFNTWNMEEREKMFSIFLDHGYSTNVDNVLGPGVQRKCGGCGATSRSRARCPCGFNSGKRKPRKFFNMSNHHEELNGSNDESSDDVSSLESPKAIKRMKRSPKPNTKYMDVVTVKTRKPPMKSCPSCEAPCHTAKTQCSKCGHSFPRKPRKPKQHFPYYSPDSFSSFNDDKDKDSDRLKSPKRICPLCHTWVNPSARMCDCGAELEFKDNKKRIDARKREPQDMDEMPVELWSEKDACTWLKTFPFGELYLSKFKENNVDGIILLEMNAKLMTDELGVENEDHITQMIESLNKPRKRQKTEI